LEIKINSSGYNLKYAPQKTLPNSATHITTGSRHTLYSPNYRRLFRLATPGQQIQRERRDTGEENASVSELKNSECILAHPFFLAT
jgi:hypothetical protein